MVCLLKLQVDEVHVGDLLSQFTSRVNFVTTMASQAARKSNASIRVACHSRAPRGCMHTRPENIAWQFATTSSIWTWKRSPGEFIGPYGSISGANPRPGPLDGHEPSPLDAIAAVQSISRNF